MKKTQTFRRKVTTSRTEYDSRLTHRVTTYPLTQTGVREWAADHNRAMPDYLEHVREWAAETLRAAGLPDGLREVEIRPGGQWAELPKDWETWTAARELEHVRSMPEGSSVGNVLALVKGRELSLEWRATRILSDAEDMESAIARGDAREAARCGIRLGEAWQQAIFAEHYELPALVGLRQIKTGKRGSRKRVPETTRADWQRQAEDHWRRHPKWSKVEVARRIAKAGVAGFPVNTIRQAIKKT